MARVSERLRYDSTNNRIDTVRQMADRAQETSVSGRKLRKVSDDPAAAVRVFRNRTKIDNIQQFRKTIDFSKGSLSRAEDALLSMNDALIRLRELCVQQSNSTWDKGDRMAVAEEVKQMHSHIVSLGNSTYADRYVFGGFQTQHPPVSAEGLFTGDDGLIYVQVDEDSLRPVNVSGREIFDVPADREGKDTALLTAVRNLYESLTTNDLNGIRNCINPLDTSLAHVTNALATVGSRRASINDVEERLDKNEERLYADNNSLEGADIIKSTLDLKRTESSLNYTLQASAKVLTPSLMSFIQ